MTGLETGGAAAAAQAGGGCFFEIAAADPRRPAVIDPSGGAVTYRDLFAWVNQVSHGLLEMGLRPRDAIAAVLENTVEFMVLQLATSQLGIVLVPVSWNFTVPEISYLLTDSGASVLVAGARFAGTAAAAAQAAGLPGGSMVRGPRCAGVPAVRRTGHRPATDPPGQPRVRLPDALHLWHDRQAEGRGASGTRGRPR